VLFATISEFAAGGTPNVGRYIQHRRHTKQPDPDLLRQTINTVPSLTAAQPIIDELSMV